MTDLSPTLHPSFAQRADESVSTPAVTAPADTPRTIKRITTRITWDGARMAGFLCALGATQSVASAARAVGLSRQSAYRLRQRLQGTAFDLAWEAAYDFGIDQLAQAALDRAINGTEVPHYFKGELVGTSRVYNERLTAALLSARALGGRSAFTRYDGELNEWQHDWDGLLERVEARGAGAEPDDRSGQDAPAEDIYAENPDAENTDAEDALETRL